MHRGGSTIRDLEPMHERASDTQITQRRKIDMMKFELKRWEVLWIALYWLILLAGVVFNHPLLRGLGAGGLLSLLVILFFTARR